MGVDSGPRAYKFLFSVGRLLANGHRPGEILGLSLRDLDQLISISHPHENRGTSTPELETLDVGSLERSLDVALRAATDLDRDALMKVMRSHWSRLGPLRFLQDFAGALMVRVGKGWETKSLEVRHEHFASACLEDFLREVREPFDQQAHGPRVVAAMLPGDAHEGGLLIASTLLAYRCYRVIYLGANTPIEQIAAATTGNAEAVALGISLALPRRMPLWVGGAGAPPAVKGVERFDDLAGFDDRITT